MQLKSNRTLSLTPFHWVLISILLLGIFFRFANLDQKAYWKDESLTSLRLTGHSKGELIREVYTGEIIDLKTIQQYQQFSSEKDFTDTIKSLAGENPEHPPLYYVLVRFWAETFGNSIAVIRSLSAVISLFIFPCIYWLCLELFDSALTGWLAIAITAVSPFHILYAQEARQYSLWTITILLSSTFLLRALRSSKQINWILYAISLLTGFYTYVFTALVAIGHGIYVIVQERFRFTKTFRSYLISSLIAALAFVPWLIQFSNFQGAGWNADKVSLPTFIKIWLLNLTRMFLDVDFTLKHPLTYCIPLVLGLIGYSIYFVCRHSPQKVWLFIVTLVGITPLALIALDIVSNEQRSTAVRYLLPCCLGIQLAVSHLFATQLTSGRLKAGWQKLWQLALVFLLTLGICSGIAISQAQIWWSKYDSNHNFAIAETVNQASQPLVVADGMGNILSLSYLFDDKVKFLLSKDPTALKIPTNFSEVFVLAPSLELRRELEEQQNYQLKSIYKPGKLWRLEKP